MKTKPEARLAASLLLVTTLIINGIAPGISFTDKAYAQEQTTTISPTTDNAGQMQITLTIPKKTPEASNFNCSLPSQLTYDATAKSATVAPASGVAGMGNITVKYYSDASRTSEVSETKNVGTYYVGITVAEGENYIASTSVLYAEGWSFSITRSTPNAPSAPTLASKTKNSVTLEEAAGCEYSKDGSAWQASPVFEGLAPNTKYSFYQRVKATDNSNVSEKSSVLEVTTDADTYDMTITLVIVDKDSASVMAKPTARTGLTFNGGDQALVNAGTGSGGKMKYALGTDSANAPASGWDEKIPVGREVKTYYVWYKVVGDSSHNDSTAACITVSINQTSLTDQGVKIYAIPDQNSTGSEITPKPVVKHLGYLLKENVDYTLTYANNIEQWESGVNPPTVTVSGMGGYSGTLENTFKIILPAYAGTVSVTARNQYTYGEALGEIPTVTTTNESGLSGETVTVKYASTPYGDGKAWDRSTVLNAGTYYVWAEVSATSIHDKAFSEREQFTVTKATPLAPSGVLRSSYQDTYKVTLAIPSGKTYADYEYAVSTSSMPSNDGWKPLPVLTNGGFMPAKATASDTMYYVFLRTKADANHNASPATDGVALKTPAKYLLRYDANGSTAKVPAPAEYSGGANAVAASAIARAGYSFSGWSTSSDGGTLYNARESFRIAENTTLYAKWTANTYKVKYHANANDATGTMSESTFTYGNAQELAQNKFQRSGYTFRGWAATAGGSIIYADKQKVSGLTTEKDGMVNLYAVWTQDSYNISGVVVEELEGTTEPSIVADVQVAIKKGKVTFGSTKTDIRGEYTFKGIPAGTYNIVATRTIDSTDQTVTKLVEVQSNTKIETIKLPTGKINSILAVTGDSTPPVMVGGLDEIARDEADSDKKVTVTMTVEQKEETTANNETKQEIEEIKDAVVSGSASGEGDKGLEFLDIGVQKKTEGTDSSISTEALTETSRVIEIIVPFLTVGRTGFSIFRHHEGRIESFEQLGGRPESGFTDGKFYVDKSAGLFYIYTNKFSTYAIGYSAEAADAGNGSDNSPGSGSGGRSGSGGGSSGSSSSGGSSASYTVPVSGGNTVNVSATISNGNAVVNEITQSDINKIIGSGNTSGSGESAGTAGGVSITIDVSGAKFAVTSVQLSHTTFERLVKTVNENKSVISVVVKMAGAAVEMDGTALSAVSSQAEGKYIKLVVENTKTAMLNALQQQSLKKFGSAQPFVAYIESGGKEIHDFNGGKTTVSVKFALETGKDAKHYHVYYVPASGLIERYATRYIDGMLSFVTNHFSDYAIVYDETMENETGIDNKTDDGSSESGGESDKNADGSSMGDNSGNGDENTGDESQTDSLSGGTANGKTAYQNALSINKGLRVSQTGSKINVSWGKVSGADRYEVYAAYCGKKFSKKPVKAITKTGVTSATIKKLNGKKLDLKKNFKVYVVAYKMVDGKKQKLGKTITAHIIGRKNAKYTNVKSLKLKESKVAIKKGKTAKIKATVVLVDPTKKMLSDSHAPTFRYASSNKKIATVNKNGKVSAKKKGACYVWVYAKNGYAKKVKITVK